VCLFVCKLPRAADSTGSGAVRSILRLGYGATQTDILRDDLTNGEFELVRVLVLVVA
jgi:hypothetical protein